MNTINKPTRAYLIRNNRPVATTMTTVRNGESVAYGFVNLGGCILQIGRAKISRAAKWLRHDAEYSVLGKTFECAHINYGGGSPI